MSDTYQNIVGIDISKEWIDVNIGKEIFRVLQTKKDLSSFIKKYIKPLQETLCVFEVTGGHEKLLIALLMKENLSFHKAHPNKILAFARAKGRLAKTDKIDARTISDYGRTMNIEQTKPLSENHMLLSSLTIRLNQLKALHHEETCRLQTPSLDKYSQKSIQAVLKVLEKQIKELEEAIQNLIKNDEKICQKNELLQSIPGVGKSVASILLGILPELGTISNKKISALVGLAPITKQSGKWTGKASIRFGRAPVRKALYMAALVASRCNKKMKEFYQRLITKGKPPKVALIATARKMLTILNVMIFTEKPWCENIELAHPLIVP